MTDRYQQDVEYLTANPKEIERAWKSFLDHPGGSLFRLTTRSGVYEPECYGCLTMVRNHGYSAATPELTAAIRADGRIPHGGSNITPDHLPVFAGWQRRLDEVLGRTPPPLDPRLPAPTGDVEIEDSPQEAAR